MPDIGRTQSDRNPADYNETDEFDLRKEFFSAWRVAISSGATAYEWNSFGDGGHGSESPGEYIENHGGMAVELDFAVNDIQSHGSGSNFEIEKGVHNSTAVLIFWPERSANKGPMFSVCYSPFLAEDERAGDYYKPAVTVNIYSDGQLVSESHLWGYDEDGQQDPNVYDGYVYENPALLSEKESVKLILDKVKNNEFEPIVYGYKFASWLQLFVAGGEDYWRIKGSS